MTTDYEALKTTPMGEYAARKNAETVARAEAEGWAMYGLIPTDEEYLSSWDNAYDYECDMALDTLSDMYKERTGTRAACPTYRRDTPLEVLHEAIQELLDRDERIRREHEESTSGEPLTDNPFARLLSGTAF